MPSISSRDAGSKIAPRRSTASAGLRTSRPTNWAGWNSKRPKIGRLDHKIEKLKIVKLVPGVEFLKTDAFSGDNGLTLTEYAPFGVIGAITPVTHSLPTLAGNAINMLAGGNTLVVNPHPGGARIACEGVQRFNQAIYEATGLDNLITIVEQPTLESAAAIFRAPRRAAACASPADRPSPGPPCESRKRAIVAGPGNPPVVVDETADLDNAARSIVKGAAYDNNLLCIGEKEVFAVEAIFDRSCWRRWAATAVPLGPRADRAADEGRLHAAGERSTPSLNKDLIGKDAARAGRTDRRPRARRNANFCSAKPTNRNPFVSDEQMMPFVPFVRVRDVGTAHRAGEEIRTRLQAHGHHPFAQRRNDHDAWAARWIRRCSCKNGPCMAASVWAAKGYLSFSIATPTGEGVTTPLTFTRQRRCTLVDDLRII